MCILTPSPELAPHSSLVHMFETVRRKIGASESAFVGKIAPDGSSTLDFDAILAALAPRRQPASPKCGREGWTPDARPRAPACLAEARARRRDPSPLLLLGTAFSFVHLLDYLVEKDLRFNLPAGSRVMETGGYKSRSRTMPKDELHALITERLGIPPENIICEYGMSELSSQAYDGRAALPRGQEFHGRAAAPPYHVFQFPPWARVEIVSPETGREVAEGETGLIRVFDLANAFSVAAVQTEDLGIRRGDGFELIGRAQLAEPRGCSVMSVESLNR